MTLKDPHNMTKGQLLDFLAHVDGREKKYGVLDSFRFQRYHDGRAMVPAEYRIDVDVSDARPAKRSRKGKEKEVPPADAATNAATNPAIYTANNAAGDTSNIDPSLLAADPVPHQSSEEEDQPEPSIRRVGEVEMAVLLQFGHPPIAPINGPNDGLPQYEVTAEAYDSCMSQVLSQRAEQVPKSRGRPPRTQNNVERSQGLASSMATPANNTRSQARKENQTQTQSGTRRSTRQRK